MPVVPGLPSASYNPNPTERADPYATTRPIRIETTPDMFGANKGRALEQLGSTLDKVGDEWASTAMQFARLDQETVAAKAATKTYTDQGNLDASFRTMQGEDPAKALVRHNQMLSDIRESNAAGLAPYARKLYDQQTLRSMGYDMRNASLYAAGQSKVAAKDARNALIEQKIDGMIRQTDLGDDNAVKQGIGDIAALETQNSVQDGDSEPMLHGRVESVIAKAVTRMALDKARTDVDASKAFLAKYEGKIHYADYQDALQKIEEKGVYTRAEQDASRVSLPMGSILERARRATKIQESRGDYGNVSASMSKTRGRQEALGAYGVMDWELPEWTTEALGHAVPKDQFLNSPEIQDKVYDYHMGKLIQRFGIEGAGRAWLGGPGGVNTPNVADPYGTRIGDYGRRFAQLVGPQQASDVTDKSLNDMQREIENKANEYYPDGTPNAEIYRAKYVDAAMKGVMTKASVQQKELNSQKLALSNTLEKTLTTKLQSTNRAPTSMEEARSLDSNFDQNVDRMEQLRPGYRQDVLLKKFAVNAKEDIPETPERRAFYTHYLGLSDQERMKVDPNQAFLNGDTTQKLAQEIDKDHSRIARGVAQGYNADRILSADHHLVHDMIYYDNPDKNVADRRYALMRGAAVERMQEFEQKNQAKMNPEQEHNMMMELAQDVMVKPGWAPTWTGDFFARSQKQYEIEGNQTAIAQARDAIARGANRDAVIRKLKYLGIDPGGL